jgi:hypothetical protein
MSSLESVRRARGAVSTIVAASALLLGACAPDTINNKGATGFDAYLSSLRGCHPLEIGSADLSVYLANEGMGNQNYQYFIDQTSMLYYNRISSAQYRESLTAFFGDSSSNAASFDCVFAKLPSDRPRAPAGRPY